MGGGGEGGKVGGGKGGMGQAPGHSKDSLDRVQRQSSENRDEPARFVHPATGGFRPSSTIALCADGDRHLPFPGWKVVCTWISRRSRTTTPAVRPACTPSTTTTATGSRCRRSSPRPRPSKRGGPSRCCLAATPSRAAILSLCSPGI